MSTTLVSPDQFMPKEIRDYLGHERIAAIIKQTCEDFIVEERQRNGMLCTVSTQSDLAPDYNPVIAPGQPVGATLVKHRMKTYPAIWELASMLQIPDGNITCAGLKDRTADTSQGIVICGADIEQIRKACTPERFERTGWFLKDPRPASGPLRKGQLNSNRFRLKVRIPGRSARQIREYVEPRLARLNEMGWVFPNAFGRQRLGRRQNLDQIGYTLITGGPEAGIKEFLCANSGNESETVKRAREEIAHNWYYFADAARNLAPKAKMLDMEMEYKILDGLSRHGSFVQILECEDLRHVVSLWVGAFQSHFFNRILSKVLRGELNLKRGESIPLFVSDPAAIRFYQEHCPEAIPHTIHPEVKRLFLTSSDGGPWRRPMVPIMHFKDEVEDGIWKPEFELRTGSYATTLLSLMFDVDQDEEGDDRFPTPNKRNRRKLN